MRIKIIAGLFMLLLLVLPIAPLEALARPVARLNNETGLRKSTQLTRQHFNQVAFAAGVNQGRSNALHIRIAGTNPALGTNIGRQTTIAPGRTNATGSTERMRGCIIPLSRTNWWAEARSGNSVNRVTGTSTLHRMP